jgi:phosphate-selective porin OprO/OprP
MRRRKVGVMALAAWLGATLPAGAAMTTEERLQALEELVRQQQQEIKELRGELRRKKGTPEKHADRPVETPPTKEEVKAEVKKEVETATKNWPEVDTKGKLEVRSKDGDFAFRLGGRVQVDAALYSNDDDTDLGSGSEFRRARLELEGTVWRVWKFRLQYDFTDTGDEGIRDAYIRYTGFKPYGVTGITAGQFKEPFSLEQLTSSKYITFMERALPDALVPARNRGFAVSTAFADAVTASAGFFGEGVDSDDSDTVDGSEGWGGTGRVTFSPIHTDDRVVHLGAAGGWRSPDEGDTVRFRQRPESHVTDVRLIDTDDIDTDDFLRLGAEAAVVYGPFSLQGEYMRAHVNRQMAGNGDLEFDGGYLFGSWFITGESRAYEFEDGAFGNIKPKSVVGKGGYGAWEVAARYSVLDLNDGDIAGGEQQDFTFGLNWYPNSNLRLLINYVRVLDVDGGEFDGAAPDVAQVRAQVHW